MRLRSLLHHGGHRAVDQVQRLTGHREALLDELAYRHRQLRIANEQTERLAEENVNLRVENESLRDAYDELLARHLEAVGAPKPALVDLEDTVPIPKVIPLSIAFAPNKQAA